ncbi:hypothetical protein SLS62_004757 [Diatrype stigma]|uniref:Alpha/beta hydrolase fold-3 domain-containing protein n=1 Tax=Diatrype stigma TaxID=117547 RepID=A0AAN9USN5_9PEZI
MAQVSVSGDQPVAIKPEDIFEPHLLAQYDPEVVKRVLKDAAAGIVDRLVPIEEVRACPEKFSPPWALDAFGWERTLDRLVTSEDGAEIPVRVYYPDPKEWGDGPYGVHLNFHGGGFIFGNLNTESSLCLSMRDGAGIVVIDVNYRHCPETVWGKCIQDGWAALLWARSSASELNIRPDSITIGGISAGGQISVVLQHIARDSGVPLKLCMPTVPPVGGWLTYNYYTDSPHRSFNEFYRGPILPWARIKYFADLCNPRDSVDGGISALWPDWWITPLKAKNWKGLCDTFVRTGAVDPLRDEGEEYGSKLVAGGNQVIVKRYPGSPHLFAYFPWFAQKQQFDRDSIKALREVHNTGCRSVSCRL